MKKFLNFFTTYEKLWWSAVVGLALTIAVIFPEEDVNGVNGKLILALYLMDTILNASCELLISKQSRWNFIVSVFIEITEIAIFILLGYRFATMATTLFFWLPIDIISFAVWSKHPDKIKKELTQVRKLTGWQEVMVIGGIVLWTIGVGSLLVYITERYTFTTLFGGNRSMEVVVCYLDAMVSALDIANGTFILLRFREQWIAWYMEVIIDAIILIIAKQYIMLVLTVGYLTNTTYGYIKWTKYINARKNGNRLDIHEEPEGAV